MIGSLLQVDFEEIIKAKKWDGLREVLVATLEDVAGLIIYFVVAKVVLTGTLL